MLEPMAEPADGVSPLVPASLALVGEGVTASELAARFDEAGARLAVAVGGRLLEQLLELGLVRVGRQDGSGRVFVLTPLGRTALSQGVSGVPAIALEDLERLRTDLLSTIAHELRTPLTALRTSVGLLADPTSSPTAEQQRAL